MNKNKLLEFKNNVDSITYDDVLALRERKAKHAIDLETLEIPLKIADQYVEVITDWLTYDLNFSKDRVDSIECRRRDGFIPFSHNNGGLEGITYRDQVSCCQHTGFKNTDAVLVKYSEYNLKSYAEDNTLDVSKYNDWTDEQRESFYEYENEDDSTVQFQARVMLTSETTANVDFYISASDAPYHRQSDDKLELEIKFKTPAGMKRELKKLLKNKFVARLAQNVREGF